MKELLINYLISTVGIYLIIRLIGLVIKKTQAKRLSLFIAIWLTALHYAFVLSMGDFLFFFDVRPNNDPWDSAFFVYSIQSLPKIILIMTTPLILLEIYHAQKEKTKH